MRKISFLLLLGLAFNIQAQSLVQSWVQIFHGASNYDQANAMAVDVSGNVFVAGATMTTNGYPDSDFATIKYSSSGLPLWTNYYDGTGHSEDDAIALKLDSKGNVFVTGVSYGPPTNGPDFLTIAYSNDGTPLWTNRYNMLEFSQDQPTGMVIDKNDNVYVTGYSSGGGSAYVTIKYSDAGLPLWTNFLGNPGGSLYSTAAIAADANGNVVIVGGVAGTNGYPDYATVKYSPAGTPLWTNYYVGPGNNGDYPYAIAVDTNGDIFVTGMSVGSGTGDDFVTVAYSSEGILLWTNLFDGPDDAQDGGTGIAVDTNGNVFVTGFAQLISGGPPHYVTLAYSGTGIPLWTNFYNNGVADDKPSAILVASNGNVCVTGYSTGIGTSSDYGTVIYSNSGLPLSTNRYNGLLNDPDNATAIATDASGNIYVTGTSDNGFATLKYSMAPPIWLSISNQSGFVVLSWTNAAFSLQSAPTVTGVFTNISGATSPYTNPVVGTQQFFRLQPN